MQFFRSRKTIQIIASAVLICMGAGTFLQGTLFRFIGLGIIGIGLIGISNAISMDKNGNKRNSDPYDLNKLYDTPAADYEPEEPDYEADETFDVAVCHRCGHGMSDRFAFCPTCGARMGY